MQVSSVSESEIRLTIEAAIVLINDLRDGVGDSRTTLTETGFSRSAEASAASIERLDARLRALAPLIESLPTCGVEAAVDAVNAELQSLPITPWIVDHSGIGPHIHWTRNNATFDDQVMADIVMSITQELTDNGTERFGRCDAEGCEAIYYDATRNRSRRFCADARCASRTHTAEHRERQHAESKDQTK